MATLSRRMGAIDALRIGEAVSFPGIDPRTWVTAGRVSDDPSVVVWDPALGWVTDVVAYGSGLEGEPIVCRTVSALGGNQSGEYLPPPLDCEAVVLIPEGDPESNPVLIGYLSNQADCKPPTTVNDLPINGAVTTSTDALVSPHDTELKVSQYHRREQYAKSWTVQCVGPAYLDGTTCTLGAHTLAGAATAQPVLRGDTTMAEILTVLNQVSNTLLTGSNGAGPVVFAGAAALTAAIAALQVKVNTPGIIKSTKVKVV